MAAPAIGPSLLAFLTSPALWIGVAAAVVLFLLTWLLLRAFGPARDSSAGGPWKPTVGQSDRRGSFRVAGSRSRVVIVGLDANQPVEGRLLDRSGTGARLEAPLPASEGATLLLRSVGAPQDAPWVPVTVRWCQPVGRRYDIGCEFVDAVLASTLALFD